MSSSDDGFVFEDIALLDDRSMQLVLGRTDQRDLALALRGVSSDVRERLLRNMSECAVELLLVAMEYQPPQRRRVVEEAERRIVALARPYREPDGLVAA